MQVQVTHNKKPSLLKVFHRFLVAFMMFLWGHPLSQDWLVFVIGYLDFLNNTKMHPF